MQKDPKGIEIIALLDSKPTLEELEEFFRVLREFYKKNLPFLIQQSDILHQISAWLKSNLSTPYNNNIFKFVVRLYQLMGFSMNADIGEYYRSHERALARDPKFLSKTYLEGYDSGNNSSDNLVDNPLLIFNLLHLSLSIVSQITKQADIEKYKPTVLILVGFISIHSYDKNMKVILRREKFFKTLMQITRILKPYSIGQKGIDADIYVLVFEIFAKLTFKCPKNQEYFMKKAGYKLVEPFIRAEKPDLQVERPILLTLANCCDQNDYQLIFWTDNFVAKIVDKADRTLTEVVSIIDSNPNEAVNSLKHLEIYLIFINRASLGCEEVIIAILRNNSVLHHLQVLSHSLITTQPGSPQFQLVLKCTATALGTLCNILEFSHEGYKLISEFREMFKKIFSHFCKIDDKLETHYQYLACLYRHLMRAIAHKETIGDEEAHNALKVGMLYFVYSKTLNSTLSVLIKYSAQAPLELVSEDDMFILSLKILEGYAYSKKTLHALYAVLCNLSIQPSFLEKASQINLYKYCLLHLQKHWKVTNTVLLIFRLLKYTLRNGLMIELFFKCYLELIEALDFNIVSIILKIYQETPDNDTILIEMLSVLAILVRNNRKFEHGVCNNQEFVSFLNLLVDESNKQLSDEMVEVLAHFPLEDLII